ncbi:cupin domain-containing protein [Nocardia sp. BSTN01]|uniref:cupin domain-containing protein n=1 Tax=Nocardia sp. BSTN01 TaxID=2783665 RepID=UPI00188DC6B5|nr:cupin domain-containing protein [Nocardia sp. BSTN01]MBF5001535.1 cupin domain-containing protein [Nocardia sp. BSTN01]
MDDISQAVRVVAAADVTEKIGRQGQHLIPCITRETCGSKGISAGMVNMAPGKISQAHYHADSEIIVVCVRGRAATLIGPELVPYLHGPGEFLYIPQGVVHVAVNLSDTDDLVAVEMRTDPMFNDDVILTPEYDAQVADAVSRLRHQLAPVSVRL